MSREKAKAHYLGKDGHVRLNCAQSIAGAFREEFGLTHESFEECQMYGGGRAPDGECGALYAARLLLERAHPARIKDCEDALVALGGSTRCRELRSARKLSCAGCVETVADCLEKAVDRSLTKE